VTLARRLFCFGLILLSMVAAMPWLEIPKDSMAEYGASPHFSQIGLIDFSSPLPMQQGCFTRPRWSRASIAQVGHVLPVYPPVAVLALQVADVVDVGRAEERRLFPNCTLMSFPAIYQ